MKKIVLFTLLTFLGANAIAASNTNRQISAKTIKAGSGILTLPTSTDTLVGRATTDTLTNKTFDANGTGNSISNIENADIATAAAIARSKLASGSANHVIINDGSGVLSSEANLAVSRGGTSLGTLTANNVILGNGTSAPLFVAPGTSGNILTSNGTTWTSVAASGAGAVVAFKAYLTGTANPSGNDPIIYNNELWDTDNAYSTSTGQFTVPSTGKYHICGGAYDNTTAGNLVVYINNGTGDTYLTEFAANSLQGNCTDVDVTATQTIHLGDTTGTNTFNGSTAPYTNWFSGYKIK